jgi:hypothetical protein
MEGISTKVKPGLRVLKSFAGAVKVKVNEIEFGLDIEPGKGRSGSGDPGTFPQGRCHPGMGGAACTSKT